MNTPPNGNVSRTPKVQAMLEQAVAAALESIGYRVERGTVGGVEVARVITRDRPRSHG